MEPYPERVVIVLGRSSSSLSRVSDRVEQLGHRTVRADGFNEAIELATSENLRFSAALMDPEIPASKLGRELNVLRRSSNSAGLVFLAAGSRPKSLARARLREAGVELALWTPVGDHDLRFQLNRAMAGWTHEQLRGELRAPSDWPTRVFARGREKSAQIYSFSGSGAFLATRRPSLTGADLTLELPLPSGLVHVAGHVVYTNVPGNRQRSQLPNGMAVEFGGMPLEVGRAIRSSVDAKTTDLVI